MGIAGSPDRLSPNRKKKKKKRCAKKIGQMDSIDFNDEVDVD